MSDLRVRVGDRELPATWTDDAPETVEAIDDELPLSGDATRWGDELYFDVPVDVPAENAREAVPVGAIAYWPRGNALCLFWGPTPVSTDGEPRAVSPVNVVASLDDVSLLRSLDGGVRVVIDRE
ncbi:cyclophilin-like fold protein [Halorubrum sp. F4]|uniref:cyclophilin-like fold protein n=1 Tax=Halorubrum sp. F4 TaxID=2989715 RepID=UPI00247FA457|nr:cyclophilin-like fold protein [Halorubrum sp. F4]